MKVISDVFGEELLQKIPCHNSISNWVKKCGLEAYNKSGASLENTDYAQIIDESMMIGEEKLLLTIGVPAEHQKRPLKFSDAHILDLAVAKSWNGERVCKQLEKAEKKVGHQPDYVISDNASILKKGIREAKMNHQRDISHSLGMYLERTYKNAPDFSGYIKYLSQVKSKYCMTNIAYLLPPTQRTIARFLNLSSWVKWSANMLKTYHLLESKKARDIFTFVPANASLIDELFDVVQCIEKLETICKHEGLSTESHRKCVNHIRATLFRGNFRMKMLGGSIIGFFNEEIKLVNDKLKAHNNSSDIIESIFGKYKLRKSPNKLYGVTSNVLLIPLFTNLIDKKNERKFSYKYALETTQISKVNKWCLENLSQNLACRRSRCLNKVA